MTTTIQQLELRFAPATDGRQKDWPVLKDVHARIPDNALKQMAQELRRHYERRDCHTRGTIVFSNPAPGLPKEWNLIPETGLDQGRGQFVRLQPVNGRSASSQQSQDEHDKAQSRYAETVHDRMPGDNGSAVAPVMSVVVEKKPSSAPVASVRVGDQGADSRQAQPGNARNEHRPGKTNTDTTWPPTPANSYDDGQIERAVVDSVGSTKAANSRLPDAQPELHWQREFLEEVGRQLESVTKSPAIKASDRVLQAEVLETVLRLVDRNPQRFTLVLYQALVELLHRVAVSDRKPDEILRLEIVLRQLDRMCFDEVNAEVDRVHEARTHCRDAGASLDLPWIKRILGMWL